MVGGGVRGRGRGYVAVEAEEESLSVEEEGRGRFGHGLLLLSSFASVSSEIIGRYNVLRFNLVLHRSNNR